MSLSSSPVSLIAIDTETPPYLLKQNDAKNFAQDIFADTQYEYMLNVFDHAGIEQRYISAPIEFFQQPQDFKTKNQLFITMATSLCQKTINNILNHSQINPEDINAIIMVNSSGIATPALDAHIMNHIDLPAHICRMPLFGLGCAGGVIGLNRACDMARTYPHGYVLLVVVELCSLTFRLNDNRKSNFVATALFGDGAAAILLKAGENSPYQMMQYQEHHWQNTLNMMGWNITNDGLEVVFSPEIPKFVTTHFATIIDHFMDKLSLSIEDLTAMLAHPGGAKVLEAIASSTHLTPKQIAYAKDILRQYGNMSASTVLFVLEKAIQERQKGDYILSALGPGFSSALHHMRIL
jgi:alkylresorcinol/alkylpyrone synthase